MNIAAIINALGGPLDVSCDAPDAGNGTAQCAFKQSVLKSLFGADGLGLHGCVFGECVRQSVIDAASGNGTAIADGGSAGTKLSGGVIAGLAVVGGLVLLAVVLLLLGCLSQRRARRVQKGKMPAGDMGGVGVEWSRVSYMIAGSAGSFFGERKKDFSDDQIILDSVSGSVAPGQMMAILGPSGALSLRILTTCRVSRIIGAGKTTLVEILAGKHKSGTISGSVSFPSAHRPASNIRIGFVPQQDVLPPTLTVREALLFAARLRLAECVPDVEKQARVDDVIERLGLERVSDVRIGGIEKRGVSGGEMRRVSIGLELVARPDVLILDEPTSGMSLP